MENVWTKQHRIYELPVTLNADRELEFAEVKGKDVPKLIRYWAEKMVEGSLTAAEHRVISAVLIYQIEKQDAETM